MTLTYRIRKHRIRLVGWPGPLRRSCRCGWIGARHETHPPILLLVISALSPLIGVG